MTYFHMTPINQPVRYNHDECSKGKSDAMIVTRHHNGWIWVCHRCGQSGFKSISGAPPSQVSQMVKEAKDNGKSGVKINKVIVPPDLINYEKFPPKVMSWLLKYELEVLKLIIGYSPSWDRAIFEIRRDKELIAWTGRTMGEVTKDNPKWFHMVRNDIKQPWFILNNKEGKNDAIVYVEDPLSAYKLSFSNAIHHTVCLMGSYVIPELIHNFYHNRKFILWLDYDARVKALKYAMKLRGLGIDVQTQITEQDPKAVPYSQMPKL